jgi:hypothetical protein
MHPLEMMGPYAEAAIANIAAQEVVSGILDHNSQVPLVRKPKRLAHHFGAGRIHHVARIIPQRTSSRGVDLGLAGQARPPRDLDQKRVLFRAIVRPPYGCRAFIGIVVLWVASGSWEGSGDEIAANCAI